MLKELPVFTPREVTFLNKGDTSITSALEAYEYILQPAVTEILARKCWAKLGLNHTSVLNSFYGAVMNLPRMLQLPISLVEFPQQIKTDQDFDIRWSLHNTPKGLKHCFGSYVLVMNSQKIALSQAVDIKDIFTEVLPKSMLRNLKGNYPEAEIELSA